MATETATRDIELTRLECGDQDNKAWYGTYRDHPEDAEKALALFTNRNAIDEVENIIYTDDISADNYRAILKVLTLYEELGKRLNAGELNYRRAQILFFATLVNYNATASKAVPRIKSYSAAISIIESQSDSHKLDYREYVISGESENWNKEYKTILVESKDFSIKIQLDLPIVSYKLGFWRFATESVPGIMKILEDRENNVLFVPATYWMPMIEETLKKRITNKFSKLENRFLNKIVKVDKNAILDILEQNNYASVIHFPNVYKMEINEDNDLIICDVNSADGLPELDTAGFSWKEIGHSKYALRHNADAFYIVDMIGNTVNILQAR